MQRLAILALVLVAIAAVAFSMSHMSGADTARPSSFPNAYVPAIGGLAEVRIVRSSMAQPGPLDVDGTTCWLAYQCLSRTCPGRGADRTPVVFAYDHAAKGPTGPYARCPHCAAKPGQDPTMIALYLTEEALTEMAKP